MRFSIFTTLSLCVLCLGACKTSAQDLQSASPTRTKQREMCPKGWANKRPESGWNRGFRAAGQDREFWLLLPPSSFKGPRPLVLALNGTTEDGKGFARRAQLQDFAARGFIVVAPSSAGNGTVWPVWDAMRQPGDHARPNADIALFDALIPCLQGHFEVDSTRIFAAGHSAGGIMTHALLQRRSSVFAGGVIASGVHSLTAPPKISALDPMFVLITWGGTRDIWKGSTRNGVATNGMNFDDQAKLIASYYAKAPSVYALQCSKNVGHAWLDESNAWIIDQLLSHPKSAKPFAKTFPPPPRETGVVCTDKAPENNTHDVVCKAPTQDAALCASACQMIADCGVENRAISSAMHDQLRAFGFSGSPLSQCTGCVETCTRHATSKGDQAVLKCMDRARKESTCTEGFEGALPWIESINTCCKANSDANLCKRICSIVAKPNSATRPFFPTCGR